MRRSNARGFRARVALVATCASATSCIFQFPDVSSHGGGGAGEGAEGAGGQPGGNGGSGGAGGSGGEVAGGSGGGGAPVSVCTTADEFDVDGPPASDCWQTVNPGLVNASALSGDLVVTPTTTGAWWEETQGYLLYREVADPFAVVAHVIASQPGDMDTAAGGNGTFKMAGLLIRDVASADEKWIKWEVGYRDLDAMFNNVPHGMLGGVTVLDGAQFPSEHVQPRVGPDVQLGFRGLIGLCRSGTSVYMFSNLENMGWTQKLDSPPTLPSATNDLPATLQVGLITGAYIGTADGIQGRFDYVRFSEGNAVTTPGECQQLLSALVDAGPSDDCGCSSGK